MKKKVFAAIIIFAEMLILSIHGAAERELSEENIEDYFLQASWACAWWEGDSDMCEEDETKWLTRIEYPEDVAQSIKIESQNTDVYTAENGIYYIVPFEEVNTKEKMRAYLLQFFTAEKVDELMNKDMPFQEGENGYLYKFPGYIRQLNGIQVRKPSDYKIISKTDKEIVLRVYLNKSKYPDKYYDYKLEKNKEGNWIFTDYINYRFILGMDNPLTSDSAVYITAAAGLIALCCAVVCKKKIKE